MTGVFASGKAGIDMDEFLQVGIIAATHGIRGEAKIFPTTNDANRYDDLKQVLLDTGKRRLPLEIQSVKYFKKFVIVKFKGIDHINDMEQYKGKSLFVSRADAVKLEEDEYFIADLLGLKVITDEGLKGTLKDVIETGANDVYVVDFADVGLVLIPAIKACILDVNMTDGVMQVHLLEGLIS